jgi:RimJ/RimL family protein N-acetyltransferase
MLILKTARLLLREAVDDDAPFVLALLNSAGFIANIGDRGVRTEAEARTYIAERIHGSYREHGFGMWVVEPLEDGAAMGLAGLVKRDGLDVPDVGYAFLPHAWGQGFAQEAAACVLGLARTTLGIPTVAAITTPENEASMAVLRKIGFVYQGMIQLPGHVGESTHFIHHNEEREPDANPDHRNQRLPLRGR